MFEELQKVLLKELKSSLIECDNEKQVLLNDLDVHKTKCRELYEKSTIPTKDQRFIEFDRQYSKISKFFNRKKYIQELQRMNRTIKEDYLQEYEKEKEKIEEIEKEIKNRDINRKTIINNLDSVEKAQNINNLPVSYGFAKELLRKNGVNIDDYPCIDIIKLGKNDMTTNNVSFMRKAIKEDVFNIIYDQTLDYNLYYDFISQLDYPEKNSEIDILNQQSFINNKNAILEFLNNSQKGEGFIKTNQILEAIRFYFKDVITYINGSMEQGSFKDVVSAINEIVQVINRAMKLSKSDYETLESLYDPLNNNYYCHKTGAENLESLIFNEGLKMSSQSPYESRKIGLTARKVDCLLAIAGYINFYAGGGKGDARIIIEIPKGVKYPIGANDAYGKNTYILPQYVIGSLYDGENVVLHLNNNEERKVYNYLYKDCYDPNNPMAIENTELHKDNIRI